MPKIFIPALVVAFSFGAGASGAVAGDDAGPDFGTNSTNTGGNFFNEDVQINGDLCVGNFCTDGETVPLGTVRVDSDIAWVEFNDASTIAGFPSNDWQIQINDSFNGGANFFAIDDVTAVTRPFMIEAGTGRVAVGSGLAAAPLTVTDGTVGDGNSMVLLQRAGGPVAFQLRDRDTNEFWNITMRDNAAGFVFSRSGTGKVELELDAAGNLYLQGNVYANGQKVTPLNRPAAAGDGSDRALESRIADLEARIADLEALIATFTSEP